MSYEEVVKLFNESFPTECFYHCGETIDYIERRETFNNFTDMLCKDGLISPEVYHNMPNPF